MTAFIQQTPGGPEPKPPAKRPPRWSLTNWQVRWKVIALALVPLLLAGTFGGLRIYASATEAADLRRAGDRAELIPPVESYMAAALVTQQSEGVDVLEAMPHKRTTTVAMGFGRITLDDDLVLYLFGTPGQRRFWFMWDDLVRGAIGAIILVDVRRLQDSFAAVDFFEARNLFLIAINEFDGAPRHPTHEVRRALALREDIPVITVDARDRHSATADLIAVTEYSLNSLTSLRG